MNITYKTDHDILEVEPDGTLAERDFKALASEIERVRTDGRDLKGLLIRTERFPGYEKFSDMMVHGEFVKEHRDAVPRVALCTDSSVGPLLEALGRAFTDADVKKFDYDRQDDAEKWLLH